jgi:hypothetical protein
MKDTASVQLDLEAAKIEFLEEMVRKYSLTDVGKAVRCLVNYARDNPDRCDDIFAEIRCMDC